MRSYNTYHIKETDKFDAQHFPKVEAEIHGLTRSIFQTPNDFKELIIISYLKNHSLKDEWMVANPALSEMIAGENCPTAQSESLFESCRNNLPFTRDYEEFIRKSIAEVPRPETIDQGAAGVFF